ncbi:hypothetical protein [Pseudomonas piscis]|uniref:hypothetical protein n=1 Tax=Pseudomonas piscis TaxID=2614538 RepID=UPI003CCD02F3
MVRSWCGSWQGWARRHAALLDLAATLTFKPGSGSRGKPGSPVLLKDRKATGRIPRTLPNA